MKCSVTSCENIYDVIRPAHFFSKCLGMTCFSFMETPGTQKRSVYMSLVDWIIFVPTITILTTLWILFFWYYDVYFKHYESPIFYYWLSMVLMTACSSTVSNSFWLTMKRKKFLEVLNLIQAIDVEVRKPEMRNSKLYHLFLACWTWLWVQLQSS